MEAQQAGGRRGEKRSRRDRPPTSASKKPKVTSDSEDAPNRVDPLGMSPEAQITYSSKPSNMFYQTLDVEGEGMRCAIRPTAALTDLHQLFEDKLLQLNSDSRKYSLRPWQKDREQQQDGSVGEILHTNLCYNSPTTEVEGPGSAGFSVQRAAQSLKGGATVSDPCAHPSGHHHYLIDITPTVNFKLGAVEDQSVFTSPDNGMEYCFDGFSLLSSVSLDNFVPFKLQRYGGEYTVSLRSHTLPQNFVTKDLLLFEDYMFVRLLELYDWVKVLQVCGQTLLFLPRFVRKVEGSTSEVLPMGELLSCLLQAYQPLESWIGKQENSKSSDCGLLITHPNKSPACIRADCLDSSNGVHFSSYSYGFPQRAKEMEEEGQAQARIVVSKLLGKAEKGKLTMKEHAELKRLTQCKPKRRLCEMTVNFSNGGFCTTGLHTDMVQQTLLLPVLTHQLLFHRSLNSLEDLLHYRFQSRHLLNRALTHTSYATVFGMTGSHEEVTMSNCGLHKPVLLTTARPSAGKGLGLVLRAMEESCRSTDAQREEKRLGNNEQLEFLGDAILEYLCSLHLYHLFPGMTDGDLTNYRRALVKNRHLATVARSLYLHHFLLLGHPWIQEGLVGEEVASHHGACCVEAIVAAVFLDGGLESAQKVLGRLLFPEEHLQEVWLNYAPDPLQQEHPLGDRHTIAQSDYLQKLVPLEESVGIQFQHIRLLAKAFSHSSLPYNNLSKGSYQCLEFLGDAVLQFVASLHVYNHLPVHREGCLSVVRSYLVQNKQLALVSKELGFYKYILFHDNQAVEFAEKILADVFESFLAALLLDKGLAYVRKFVEVCLFPKLQNLTWSSELLDPASRLHMAVAFTCKAEGTAVEMPHYRTLQGSSNMERFRVAVYFRGKRIGLGTGNSLRQARAAASQSALDSGHLLIPTTDHERALVKH